MSDGTKSRNFFIQLGGLRRTQNGGKTWTESQRFQSGSGKQLTVSEGHPIDPKTGRRVGGGPFYSVRTEVSFPTTRYRQANPFNPREIVDARVGTPQPDGKYKGEIGKSFETIRSSDTSDLDAPGATMISLCSPTNPYSNIATSVAEAHREGLPSLPGVPTWKKRTEVARAAGSEYLNAVFGWLPLVDEVKNVGHAARHSRDILFQYRRDEGRDTRRGYSLPPVESSSSSILDGLWTAATDLSGSTITPQEFREDSNRGTITRSRHTVTRQWFSGAFTYTMSPFGDSLGSMDRYGAEADKLFGISLTPDVLWELTPWSWAVDWFSNAGMVINNFTNMVDHGLVLRYGYVMSETVDTITYSLSKPGLVGLRSVPNSQVITTSKVRAEANPFGFGIGWEGLSPSQLAITAALGITRLR